MLSKEPLWFIQPALFCAKSADETVPKQGLRSEPKRSLCVGIIALSVQRLADLIIQFCPCFGMVSISLLFRGERHEVGQPAGHRRPVETIL